MKVKKLTHKEELREETRLLLSFSGDYRVAVKLDILPATSSESRSGDKVLKRLIS